MVFVLPVYKLRNKMKDGILYDELANGDKIQSTSDQCTDKTKENSGVENSGSYWRLLPYDIAYIIINFLGDTDMLGYLPQISKSTPFTPADFHYQSQCMKIYTKQCAKKIVNLSLWGSWRYMLANRPRLRTNGFYSIRMSYWKPPNNDAFWEERRREFIEVKFYRHLRFYDNGIVLYSLDNNPPWEAYKILQTGCAIPKKLFFGQYILSKRDVTVKIPLHYAVIHFRLLLLDAGPGFVGNFNRLQLLEHKSSNLNTINRGIDDPDIEYINYKLPSNTDLGYYRHWSW